MASGRVPRHAPLFVLEPALSDDGVVGTAAPEAAGAAADDDDDDDDDALGGRGDEYEYEYGSAAADERVMGAPRGHRRNVYDHDRDRDDDDDVDGDEDDFSEHVAARTRVIVQRDARVATASTARARATRAHTARPRAPPMAAAAAAAAAASTTHSHAARARVRSAAQRFAGAHTAQDLVEDDEWRHSPSASAVAGKASAAAPAAAAYAAAVAAAARRAPATMVPASEVALEARPRSTSGARMRSASASAAARGAPSDGAARHVAMGDMLDTEQRDAWLRDMDSQADAARRGFLADSARAAAGRAPAPGTGLVLHRQQQQQHQQHRAQLQQHQQQQQQQQQQHERKPAGVSQARWPAANRAASGELSPQSSPSAQQQSSPATPPQQQHQQRPRTAREQAAFADRQMHWVRKKDAKLAEIRSELTRRLNDICTYQPAQVPSSPTTASSGALLLMQQQLNARMSVRESRQNAAQRPAPVVRGVPNTAGARGTLSPPGVDVTRVPGGADEVDEANGDEDEFNAHDHEVAEAVAMAAPSAQAQARGERTGAPRANTSWSMPVPPFCHRVVVSGSVTQHLREFDGVTVSTHEVRAPSARGSIGASATLAATASPGSRVVALRDLQQQSQPATTAAAAAVTASQLLPSPSAVQPPVQARLQARSPQETRYAPASSLLRLADGDDDGSSDGDEPGVTYAPSRPLDGAALRRAQSTPARGGYEARYSRLSPRRVVQGDTPPPPPPPHYAARTVSFAAHTSPPRATSPAADANAGSVRPRSALRTRAQQAHAQSQHADADTAELYPRNGSYASYAERYRLSRVHQMQPMLPLLP